MLREILERIETFADTFGKTPEEVADAIAEIYQEIDEEQAEEPTPVLSQEPTTAIVVRAPGLNKTETREVVDFDARGNRRDGG